MGVEPGVRGKFVSLGIAGTLSAGAVRSAGRDELDAGAVAGAPALVLPRDDGLSSLEIELGASAAQVEAFRRRS